MSTDWLEEECRGEQGRGDLREGRDGKERGRTDGTEENGKEYISELEASENAHTHCKQQHYLHSGVLASTHLSAIDFAVE